MLVTLPQAAAQLNCHEATLRRWLRDGCPVSQRGRRGRGKRAMFDVCAIRAWRDSSNAIAPSMKPLASVLPELLADVFYQNFIAATGPHKRILAGEFSSAWYAATNALLDRMRQADPSIPELQALPEKIEHLRAIFRQSDNVHPSHTQKV